MTGTVKLVFAGEVLDGFDPVEVMARVAHTLQVDEARMAHLFSGRRVVLRRGVEATRGQRYALQFARMGARLHLEPDDGAPSNPAAAAPAASAPAPPVAAASTPAAAVPDSSGGYGYSRRRKRPTAPGAPVFGIGMAGRLGRQPYAAAGLVAVAAMALATAFAVQHPVPLRLAVAGAVFVAATLLSLRWTVLRLHDFGRPGHWAWLVAVPWLGVLAGAAIASVRSDRGANAHGEEPRRGPWWRTALFGSGVALATGVLMAVLLTQFSPLGAQLSGQAAAVFNGPYQRAGLHKAFALSPGASFGWRAGLPTRADARREAVANCERYRPPGRPRCTVIDIDGAPPGIGD